MLVAELATLFCRQIVLEANGERKANGDDRARRILVTCWFVRGRACAVW